MGMMCRSQLLLVAKTTTIHPSQHHQHSLQQQLEMEALLLLLLLEEAQPLPKLTIMQKQTEASTKRNRVHDSYWDTEEDRTLDRNI